MKDRLVTLAVHTPKKANILKGVLEKSQIEVHVEELCKGKGDSIGVKIRIKESDLPKALTIIEGYNLFSYADEKTYQVDDGKRRILVPVDFSEYSLNACHVAFNLAEKIDAKVKIFNVFYSPYYPSSLPIAGLFDEKDSNKDDVETVLSRVRKNMLKLCSQIDEKIASGEYPAINYSYAIREGQAEEEIEDYVKEYKPVLIIMGARGSDENISFPIGNVTADIIESTDVPVLAIPTNSTFLGVDATVKKVAFLTNFSSRDLMSFEVMCSFTKPMSNIKVTLVHINKLDRKGNEMKISNIEKIKKYFSEKFPELQIEYKLIDSKNIVKGVVDCMKDEKFDILALNTRKRNLLGRIFIPSMSRKILLNLNTTLLVLRG